MKKIVAMAVVAAVTVSMVCAQIGVTAGVKGTFGMNLGSQVADKDIYGDDVKDAFMVNGGGSLYGRYNMPFHAPLGVQLEFGITGNNGAGIEAGSGGETMKTTLSYLSLDIPLIVTYDISAGPVVITPMVGVNFSIPVGKPTVKMEVGGTSAEMDMGDVSIVGFIPGLVAGVEVGIPAGPGSVTAGLSYVNDFMPVKASYEGVDEKQDLLTRRNFNISVGYALKF